MTASNLQKQLKELRLTLDSNPQLDAESLVLLQQLAADIEDMDLDDSPDITEFIQEQAVGFEQDYPTLSAVLRQLVETLGRIGV